MGGLLRFSSTRSRLSLFIALCVVATCAPAASATKVLVLLDSLDMQQTHSKFLQSINPKTFDVTVASIDTKTTKLQEWDEWLFDKVIILGGKNKLGAGVRPTLIAEFFNSGHDVLLALDAAPTTQLRDLAVSLGVDVAPAGNVVIDHFNFNPKLGGDHTAVTSPSLAPLSTVFRADTKGPVAFQGVALSVSIDSEVAFHVVTASATAYSGVVGKPAPTTKTLLAGPSIGLLTLVQGRNNARAAVSGSTAMFSNAFFAAAAGNAAMSHDVVQWTLQMKSVLRASPLRHRIVDGEVSPATYRINDVVEVAVDIEECSAGMSKCKPFVADDVQIEFVMLDPYLRITLDSPGKNGTFSQVVKVPDVYGVFKWVLEYRRLGYTWLSQVMTVPVRPFRHDEYERFIVQAYPYYASTASMMAGFFALGFYFLYSG